ncbi:hypothetical protein RCL_jg9767.t1 [Rhizophagus clarus]|uniref:Uncharacterized protein n=1 Tax=Rhizophagus clarus TaxID=94130 RepID=A0A8H3QWV2_9GLOM|nr:hypothetical protein RCL_jg9767.t1 [Rhizophagus clarus]
MFILDNNFLAWVGFEIFKTRKVGYQFVQSMDLGIENLSRSRIYPENDLIYYNCSGPIQTTNDSIKFQIEGRDKNNYPKRSLLYEEQFLISIKNVKCFTKEKVQITTSIARVI